MSRMNYWLELLLFMERNGILCPKGFQQDHTIKSDNGMSIFPPYSPFHVSPPHNKGSITVPSRSIHASTVNSNGYKQCSDLTDGYVKQEHSTRNNPSQPIITATRI